MADETTGSDQFFVWKVGAEGTYAAAGYVIGGGGPRNESSTVTRQGANSEQANRDGLIDPVGDIQLILSPDGGGLLSALAPGTTADLYLAGDVGEGVVEHTGCFPTKVTVKQSVGGALELSFSWFATAVGVGAPTAVALADPWDAEVWESTTLLGGESLGMQSVQYEFEYATRWTDDGDGRIATAKRTHRGIVAKGLKSIKIACEMLVPTTEDLTADYPATDLTTSTQAVTNSTTPYDLGIEVTNLKWDGIPTCEYQSDKDGLAVWKGAMVPAFLSASVVTVTAAAEGA